MTYQNLSLEMCWKLFSPTLSSLYVCRERKGASFGLCSALKDCSPTKSRWAGKTQIVNQFVDVHHADNFDLHLCYLGWTVRHYFPVKLSFYCSLIDTVAMIVLGEFWTIGLFCMSLKYPLLSNDLLGVGIEITKMHMATCVARLPCHICKKVYFRNKNWLFFQLTE